jgi:hypothetical protein
MATIAIFLSVFLQFTHSSAQASITPARYRTGLLLDQVIPQDVQKRIDERKKFRALGIMQSNTQDFSGLPASLDLRNRDTHVLDQEGPTCTIHGLISTMENILGNGTDLSEADGWDNQGGVQHVTASQRANAKYGIVEEKFWPWEKPATDDYCTGTRYKPTGIEYIEDDIEAAVRHLATGKPIYIGMSTPNSMYSCDSVINPDHGTTGGGHAVAIIGYRLDSNALGGGYFLVKNSWGTDCGEQGYQWLPFGTCAETGFYCMMYQIGGVGIAERPSWCGGKIGQEQRL